MVQLYSQYRLGHPGEQVMAFFQLQCGRLLHALVPVS